jgi:hypothetical protein
MNPVRVFGLFGLCSVELLFAACVQLPTEKRDVADIRPSISFAISGSLDPFQCRVLVDSLDMGVLSNFLVGVGALRVLSGTHLVRTDCGGKSISQENIYLGNNATRTLQVSAP